MAQTQSPSNMCHWKNWPVKRLCGRCLSDFTDRRYSQYADFRPSFVNCWPSNLLSGSTHLLPSETFCGNFCSILHRGHIQRKLTKNGVWNPTLEFNITSPYVHSRVDSHSFTMGNPMPESTLTLCQSRLNARVDFTPSFGFGLGPCAHPQLQKNTFVC